MKRVRVKICGITRVEQAVAISHLNVDALGFILYPKSPRYIAPDRIRPIINALPPFTKTVGVFVNEPVDDLVETMEQSGLDIAQLSGDEPVRYCQELTNKGINWIQSFRIRSAEDLDQIGLYPGRFILLDAWSKDAYGGTGNTFDWNLLKRLNVRSRIVLAGGLNTDNVEQAIREIEPYGLDISSGVEESSGIKSMKKVHALLDRINLTVLPDSVTEVEER